MSWSFWEVGHFGKKEGEAVQQEASFQNPNDNFDVVPKEDELRETNQSEKYFA